MTKLVLIRPDVMKSDDREMVIRYVARGEIAAMCDGCCENRVCIRFVDEGPLDRGFPMCLQCALEGVDEGEHDLKIEK